MKTVTYARIPGDEYDLFILNVDTHAPSCIFIAKNTLNSISSSSRPPSPTFPPGSWDRSRKHPPPFSQNYLCHDRDSKWVPPKDGSDLFSF